MLERQSALASGALTSSHGLRHDGQCRLRMGEVRGWNLVQIAAFDRTFADLEKAIRPVLHRDLPLQIGKVVDADGRHLLKTGTDQYWVITRDGDDLSHLLRTVVAPSVGSVTPLSHSRTRIFIEGTSAGELLQTGIALDFHPDIFVIGQFALTGLHHIPVLIHRNGKTRYELYAMRTFALSVWEWLSDGAPSFGYEAGAVGTRD